MSKKSLMLVSDFGHGPWIPAAARGIADERASASYHGGLTR